MPKAKNPNKREFYAYRLLADFVPYYVGIGRSARASDRVRYVRYMMARESKGKAVRWEISSSATAALLRKGCNVEVTYTAMGMTRREALVAELADLRQLLERGLVLANIQKNPKRVRNYKQIVAAVLAYRGSAGAVRPKLKQKTRCR